MGILFYSDQAIGQLTVTRPLLKYKMRNVRRCHCCQAQFLPEGFSLHILSCVVVKRREERERESQLALKANESSLKGSRHFHNFRGSALYKRKVMTSLAQQSYSTGYARGSPPGFEGDLYLQQQFSRGEMPPRPCRYEDRSPRGESPEGRQSGGEDRPACDYATGAMAAASLQQYSSCIPGKVTLN